jgi:acylphosphatase
MAHQDRLEQARIIVRGRVQGVGFRFWARDLADALALRGTVRNLPDGRSVECVVQGEPSSLRRFTELARRGPPGAHVESFESHAESPTPNLLDFDIIH